MMILQVLSKGAEEPPPQQKKHISKSKVSKDTKIVLVSLPEPRKKKTYYFPLKYWLFNRDPYNGLF